MQENATKQEGKEQNRLVVYTGPQSSSFSSNFKSYSKLILKCLPAIQILHQVVFICSKLFLGGRSIDSQIGTKKQLSFRISYLLVGVGTVLSFLLWRKIHLSPQKKAERFFQLDLKKTNERQVKWVYNVKKKYYQKFANQHEFYQRKLRELNQHHQIFKKQLQNRK